MARLDHLTVIAPDLASGARFVREALGIEPGPGRQHPDMGTHNLLLSLGPGEYLEVIAVDPQAARPAHPRWFGLDLLEFDTPPRLGTWVAGTEAIAQEAVPELGRIIAMSRAGRGWEMTVTPDGRLPFEGAVPSLIQRSTGPHPASVLPDAGLRLQRLAIRHPQPDQVLAALARMGLAGDARIRVLQGTACILSAEIASSSGGTRAL